MERKVKSALRLFVFVLAVAVTTGWVVLCFGYLNRLGWDGLLSLDPGPLAATLAAGAGPPVALWLILMVIGQRQELADLQKGLVDFALVLRRGQDQAEINGRALLELTAASHRSAAQDGLALILDDITSHAAVVAERLGVLDPDGIDMAWARYGAGDRWALIRPFLDRSLAEDDFESRLRMALNDDVQSRLAADAFLRRLEMLRSKDGLPHAQKMIQEVLEDGPMAQVARFFQQTSGGLGELENDTSNTLDSIDDRLGPQPTLFQPDSKSA
ncbi:MAG: hypothetical protein RJS98_08890 [Rhodospirillaceae bacterium]